jgi:hypothetical protein
MTTAQEPSPLRRVAAALDALMYATASAPSPLHETLHPAGAATSSLDAVGFLSPDVTEQNARNGRLPSDRLSYLRRLRTFRPGLWLGRPPCCDAVAAARHGWCAQAGEPDCLVCGAHGDGCGATLALILPPRADAAAVDEVRGTCSCFVTPTCSLRVSLRRAGCCGLCAEAAVCTQRALPVEGVSSLEEFRCPQIS